MALPRTIEIDGRRYLWRDLVALRRAQATPTAPQPVLFPLRDDHRPAGERTAADRYREPSLFTVLERHRIIPLLAIPDIRRRSFGGSEES